MGVTDEDQPRPTGPLTEKEIGEILRLQAAGVGRNDIMRLTGRSAGAVSRIVARDGRSFNRATEVAAATETRRADLGLRRMLLAEQLQADAENLRAQLWAPTVVFAFGGKENTYEEHELPEPPAADKKNIMATVGMAIDRSLKLAPPVEASGVDDAKSMLGKLFTGLKNLAEQQESSDEGDGDAP